MSQQGILKVNTGGNPTIEFITGNSGGPVGPDGAHNINLLGNNATGINVVGTPGTNTLTITALQATILQRGTVFLATDAQAIAGTDTVNALTSSNLTAKLGTQTAHSLAVFEGTASALTALGVAGNGQLPIGSVGADPVLANLTSAGATITITNGPGSIDLAVNGGLFGKTITGDTGGALSPTAGNWNIFGASVNAISTPVATAGAGSTLTINVQKTTSLGSSLATSAGLASFNNASFTADVNGYVSLTGTGTVQTMTGNSGGALSPTAGNMNTLGTGSITIAGAGSTLTTQLTGLTNHAVLVGAGTATITKIAATANTGAVLQNNSGADPSYSTATYPSTTTINQILYSSAANTVTGLATANQGVLTTGATGVPVITALATDGQLIIGSTAGVPAASTLTPGAGISITNAGNSITIAATGAGFAWSDQSGAFAAVKENGYFITATSTATLPASPAEGDTISFVVDSTQFLTITGNTGQKIRIGSAISAAAGTAVNNARGDAVELVYRSTGTTWISTSVIGTWSVT